MVQAGARLLQVPTRSAQLLFYSLVGSPEQGLIHVCCSAGTFGRGFRMARASVSPLARQFVGDHQDFVGFAREWARKGDEQN